MVVPCDSVNMPDIVVGEWCKQKCCDMQTVCMVSVNAECLGSYYRATCYRLKLCYIPRTQILFNWLSDAL